MCIAQPLGSTKNAINALLIEMDRASAKSMTESPCLNWPLRFECQREGEVLQLIDNIFVLISHELLFIGEVFFFHLREGRKMIVNTQPQENISSLVFAELL